MVLLRHLHQSPLLRVQYRHQQRCIITNFFHLQRRNDSHNFNRALPSSQLHNPYFSSLAGQTDEKARLSKNGDSASVGKTATLSKSFSSSLISENLSRLLDLSRSEWTLIGMSASTLAVTSSVTLLLPYASGNVIDYTISSGGDGTSPVILATGLFGLSALVCGGVFLRTLWLAQAGNRIVARLKQRLYASILQQDSAFLDQQSTGDLLSRLTSDAQLVQGALTTQFVAGLRASIMSLGAGGMLIYTSPLLALVSCATLPPIFILSRHFGRQLREQQSKVQELLGEASSLAEQALNHSSTVKQSTAEVFESTRYHNAIAAAHAKSVATAHMQAKLEAGAHVSGNAAILGVLGMGGTMVLDGSISAGDLTGFVMYSLLLAGNLSSLTSIYSELVRAMAASSRIFELMDRQPVITSPKSVQEEKKLLENDTAINNPLIPIDFEESRNTASREGEYSDSLSIGGAAIEIENLTFRYPSRPDVPVLENFNLVVPPGSVVAIVGSSGSGKSTIASLLTRLYDADPVGDDASPIRINGKSIRDYDTRDLRQMIGVVSQDPVLFRGSIRDNIKYGMWENVSDEDVVEAARQAFVLDFANNFPDGLDTMVGPRGMMLSGGQRQRIAIARMLANKRAPIYILDEATSALDAQSEHYVQSALQKIFEDQSGRTIISIAHRLSTIRHATTIAVVRGGRIVQQGTFDELSTLDGPFRELMKTQLIGNISRDKL
ncbi:efflux ABC transporter permease/ATP-binding protein [Nitzschia inconspicua]|uniref:Efflux ABC transporter permease/ATP-binding protein n=1 Tax=Nitzschia inconspicua TaxID=303405 RepID=A0A9K3KGI7_9STRA|nr:efflux ABC transporter permease/ATP-binding protein [Nitzschia inconspicua]